MRFVKTVMMLSAAALAAGCQSTETAETESPDAITAAELYDGVSFRFKLLDLCGETLTGAVVSDDPQDVDWRGKVLTVGPITCETGPEFVMTAPLAVGEDKSRVWTIKGDAGGLSLSHAHTLKDGSPDPVTGYGGHASFKDMMNSKTPMRVNFPADQYSVDLFKENGLEASVTNVWSLEIQPGVVFAYELNREGRHFRAEFDLTP